MYANKLGKKIFKTKLDRYGGELLGDPSKFLFMKRLFYLERQLGLIRILEV